MTTTSVESHIMQGHVPVAGVRDGICLDGQWELGAGPAFDVINPANGELVQTIHQADAEQAARAIAIADTARRKPEWSAALPHERAMVLHEIARGIDENADWLARLQTANTGKTLSETTTLVASAARTFRYFAAAAESMDGQVTARRGPWQTTTQYEPLGVIAAITPWNSPIASDAQKIAPALAAGNAVVLKPAEWTPLVAMGLMQIIDDSSLPKGLCTILPGKGSVIGDVITSHPAVSKIAFTGGTATGRRIARAAADRFIPCTLELGGKSPNIVLADADIDSAVAGVLFGIFSSSGQSCIAGSRLFVHRSLYREVVDRIVESAKTLTVGPGIDAHTKVGPLVHRRHRDEVDSWVQGARAEGGTVLCGGAAPSGDRYDIGNYYLPTVIEGLPNSSQTCQQEIFGPVLVCLPFDDEEDLVSQANDTVYGLAAGIWTRDYQVAARLADRINAGTIWVNTYKQFSISTPFSGFKDSGLGVDKGRAGLAEYSQLKSVYWGLDHAPNAWANPDVAESR